MLLLDGEKLLIICLGALMVRHDLLVFLSVYLPPHSKNPSDIVRVVFELLIQQALEGKRNSKVVVF